VVVLWQEEALAPGSGRRIVLPALGVYRVRDGKVIESRMFQDTAVVRVSFVGGQQKNRTQQTQQRDHRTKTATFLDTAGRSRRTAMRGGSTHQKCTGQPADTETGTHPQTLS